MNKLNPFITKTRLGVLLLAYAASASVTLAGTTNPPSAGDDDLTSTPFSQDAEATIDESTLTANDSGDGIGIDDVVGSTSDKGATIDWAGGPNEITYDPRSVAAFIALDSGESTTDTFDYTLTGDDPPDDTAEVTVQVNGVNDAPTLTGISGTANIDDDETTTPFSSAVVGDVDIENVTVTVTVGTASEGVITNLDGFSDDTGGVYTYTGSTTNAQSKLRGLVFDPTENRLAPGASDTTAITAVISDGDDTSATRTRTVNVTSVNDAPTLANLGGTVSIDDDETTSPFTSGTIADPDLNASITVTVTVAATDTGTMTSLGGFANPSTGTYTFTGTPAAATTALTGMVFTPANNRISPGLDEDTTLTVTITDGIITGSAPSDTRIIDVNSVNDDPVLSPSGPFGPFSMSAGSTIQPFVSITSLTDADFEIVAGTGGLGGGGDIDTFTATITLSPSPHGTIISDDFSGSGSTYAYTAARADVLEAIQNVQYQAPGSSSTFTISVSVADEYTGTSNAVVATATVTQPNPGITGLITSGQQLADDGVIFPFATALFNAFGDDPRRVEVSLDADAKGTFEDLGPFTKVGASAPYVYRMTGSSADATTAIRNLRFVPTENRITGTSETVSLTIEVLDQTGTPSLFTATPVVVTVFPTNDAPTINSTGPEIRINDDVTTNPFAALTVTDLDAGGAQLIVLEITLEGADPDTSAPVAGGGRLAELTASGYLTTSGTYPNVTYTLTGTPSQVTSAMQALVFTPGDPPPAAERWGLGQVETVTFTLFVEDFISAGNAAGGSDLDTDTLVIVTYVNGAPFINGVPPLSQQPFPIAGSADGMGTVSSQPFKNLTVFDDDTTITFVITLDDAMKGTLTSLGSFADSGGGVYTMTDSPANIQTDLQALVYELSDTYSFPVSTPGLTKFTLSATDPAPASNNRTLDFEIFVREQNISHIVTVATDNASGDALIAGSLREALNFAGINDSIVFEFAPADYPVTIHLQQALSIGSNISIIGSGVDELTISGDSDDDGTGDVPIFIVGADVEFTVEQLTLSHGVAASYGGAISAATGSVVNARYCSFENNSSGQYGGAIDIFDGQLFVEGCLFLNNSVLGTDAVAGGAISAFTNSDSLIRNSTFVGNVQGNAGGEGGASIYAQNSIPELFFNLLVEHCTFKDNTDAASSGSAILSSFPNTIVQVRNNIFTDPAGAAGVVIDVVGAGEFDSLGGNIATDSTSTTYTQGGTSENIDLLDPIEDELSVPIGDIMLLPLADNGGATLTIALDTSSSAIDTATIVDPLSDGTGLDQRGVWRDALPDVGAFEAGIFKRVNINEIYVQEGIGDDFIEFYNPRDSEALDMVGLELWVDGALAHTFGAQALVPGAGFDWTATVDLEEEKGTLELRNSDGQVLLLVDYIGNFSESGTELDITGQSITRYPNFEGGFLPHQRIVTLVTGTGGGSLTSPGDDVTGAPLNGGNAPPIAVVDLEETGLTLYCISATETLRPDLLSNDIEFDRTDTLKITEVMDVDAGDVVNQELLAVDTFGDISLVGVPTADGVDTTFDPVDVDVTIDGDGLGLTYDPTTSPDIIALAKDEEIFDIWAYTMRDYNDMDVAQSRGADAAKQAANIIKATSYFTVKVVGVNEAPETTDDTAATAENHALRLLADVDLISNPSFGYGDLSAAFEDFDSDGNLVTLLPLPPTVALLSNDDDVDSDDDETTLLIVGVHQGPVVGTTVEAFSEKGARVKLDLRANRSETSVLYDPRTSAELNKLSEGEVTTDTFYYTIRDQHGAEVVGKVTITVTGVNDAPTATDDLGFSVFEDDTLDITEVNLLDNDSDPDQDGNGPDDTLEIDPSTFPTTSAQGAIITFDGTTVTYDPAMMTGFEELARNETLDDSFQYTLLDTFGTQRVATVFLVVTGNNDTPVAEDGIQLDITENDTTLVPAGTGLLENLGDIEIDINGSPPDDDPWVIAQRGVTTPLGAALNINPDGSYSYDANSVAIDALIEDEMTTEVFNYIVTDNSRTRAIDDMYKVESNRTDVTLPVLSNDAVVGSAPIAVVEYSEDLGDANVTIIESADHSLRDGLLVRIVGYAGAAPYNGVFPITSIDADHFSIPVAFDVGDLTTGGTWQPWFNITAVSVADNGGTPTIATDGQSLLYTADSNFYGEETFTYTIEDGAGGQDVASVTILNLLSPLNGTIRANNDTFRVGTSEAGIEVDVLANDNVLPALGSDLTITEVSPAASGVTIINGGQALSYDAPGAPTSDVFTYTVSGGGTSTAQATVTFEVEDRTDLLSGNDDSFFVVTGSSNVLLDVIANDSNLPSFPVVITLDSVQYAGTGSATVSGNSISYTPPPFPFLSTETFTYVARDASGATTTQTVQVEVVADAVDFRAQPDHYRVVAGSGMILLPVLVNDGAIQNETATLSIVNLGLDTDAPPDAARVAIDAGLTFIEYTPPTSATTETFNYEIGIGTIERREAVITVEVVDSFEVQPDASDDVYDVARDSGPHTLDVLANDLPYPLAGWSWTIDSVTAPDQSGVAVNDAGTAITYTPAPGFFGTETFSYTIEDVFGDSSTATVMVKVGELIVCPDAFVVLQDTTDNPLQVLSNDDLLDRYAADYTIVLPLGAPDQGGSVSIDGSGPNNQILYSPDAGFIGEETFTYTVEDATGATTSETVTVTVVDALSDRDDADLTVKITGINDIPMLSGTTTGAGITDKETINPFLTVLITDLDEFGLQSQSISVTFDATYGSIVAPGMMMNAPGDFSMTGTPAQVTAALRAIVFTPTENVIDYISPGLFDLDFDLSINDGYTGGLVQDTTTVRITPVNDAPTKASPISDLIVKVNSLPRGVLLTPHFADVDDDVPAGELTYSVLSNTNPSLFDSLSVNQTTEVLNIDFATEETGVAVITVRATDRGGLTVDSSFTVTVEGHPVIELEDGETQPPTASYVSGPNQDLVWTYEQSFRVTNEGVLPAEAFILHITDAAIATVSEGEYSTDENGTPDIFDDDTRTSAGVTILSQGGGVFEVKYDRPIPAGESVVVHVSYEIASLVLVPFRPDIRVELTTATPSVVLGSGISAIKDPVTAEVALKFAAAAGTSYRVEYTDDLSTPWTPWGIVTPEGDFDREVTIYDDGFYTDPHPSFAPNRFYRIIEIVAP